jgi:hypothetical protein
MSTSNWTVVLSGPPRESLADHLARQCGLALLVIPDLYDLPAEHPALAAMQQIAGPICFVSDYLPRAVYWMLAWRGIRGRRADCPQTRTTGRPIHAVCIAGADDHQAAERVLAVTGQSAGPGSIRRVVDSPSKRWYPVIDFDRCTSCLACAEFCLFGVYEASSAAAMRVERPDSCKGGCPACSFTCPAGAIMFPRYAPGGAVAGEDAGTPERLEGDALRHAARQSIGQWAPRPDAPAQRAKLDKTVDELESF